MVKERVRGEKTAQPKREQFSEPSTGVEVAEEEAFPLVQGLTGTTG